MASSMVSGLRMQTIRASFLRLPSTSRCAQWNLTAEDAGGAAADNAPSSLHLCLDAAGVAAELPLALGLPPLQIVLLTLTLWVSAVTLGSGRATVMHGAIHLVLFAAFLFLTVVP